MLAIEDLNLKYGQSQILTGITLNAPVGQVTCVTGTNGARNLPVDDRQGEP